MKLTIPTAQRESIATLLQVPVSNLRELLESIQGVKAASSLDGLLPLVLDKTSLQEDVLSSVLGLVLPWAWLRIDSEMSAEETLSQIESSAKKLPDPKYHNGWAERKEILAELISLDYPIGTTAKAWYLGHQAFRVYGKSRILTDARPVFPSDVKAPPNAFKISHTLQVEARDSDVNKDWYFTMDLEDLRDLKLVVDRAIEKHESLRVFLTNTSTTVLE